MRNLFQMCFLPYLYDLKQNVVAYAAEVTAETSLWRANQNNFSLNFIGPPNRCPKAYSYNFCAIWCAIYSRCAVYPIFYIT